MLFNLLKYKMEGELFIAIAGLYNGTLPCVHVNHLRTAWFETNSGVRQGDSMLRHCFPYT